MGEKDEQKKRIHGVGISFGSFPSTPEEKEPEKAPAEPPAEAPVAFQPAKAPEGLQGVAPGPFRIVVFSELTAQSDYSTGPRPRPEPLAIDRYAFDDRMASLSPSLMIELPDPFVAKAPPLRIDLRWRSLKSLRPDAIVDQVPVLRALADARVLLQQVTTGQVSAAEAQRQLERQLPRAEWAEILTSRVTEKRTRPKEEATSGGAAPKKQGSIDSLLDMVDVAPLSEGTMTRHDVDASGGSDQRERQSPAGKPTPQEKPVDPVSSIVAAVALGRRPGASGQRADVGDAPTRIETAFKQLLLGVLRHPEVRRLERAWRGLRLLVEHAETRAGVAVDVVPVGPDGVSEVLESLLRRDGPEAHRAPIDLLVVDWDLDPTARDLERLESWAQGAEQLRAPLVTNGHPSFLGVETLEALGSATRRLSNVDDPRAVAARAVASRDPSRWVTVAMNGALVRRPYSTSSAHVREIAFAEDATDHEALVFARPAYVIAALAAESYVRIGWPCAITGPHDGALENLQVYEVNDRGSTIALPLEAFVTQDAQTEAARAGFAVLSCAPNHDAAILGKAPVLYRGPTAATGGDPAASSTLSDQLFVGRLSYAIEQLAGAIPASTDAKTAEQVAHIALAELFKNAPPVGPEIHPHIDTAAGILEVTVRPRRYASVSMEEVTLAAKLR